ncbi:hypothetical protein [Brasilonema bromeliae]|nr:hypothetical protein [Brasilonema bromeliae]
MRKAHAKGVSEASPFGAAVALAIGDTPVAHGGNYATCYKSAQPPNAVAPQDRAGSPFSTRGTASPVPKAK